MALFMILMTLVVFMFFAMSLDAGVWYFDHRTAQNQSEAAALAAVIELPATDTIVARAAADDYLSKNGAATTSSLSCPVSGAGSGIEFADLTGDGKMDAVTVCVHRDSPAFFAKLANIETVSISAKATARTGPIDNTNVMPWAIVAPDPTCTEAANRNCRYDANGDGDLSDAGDCNAAWTVCPFGLTADRLYTFKAVSGGNTGIIQVCGGNGTSLYRACLAGQQSSGFYQVGQTVAIDLSPGNRSGATNTGLQLRPPAGAWNTGSGATACDVSATPMDNSTQSPGYDPDGKSLATARFVNPTTNEVCAYRLVPIPIIPALPSSGGGTVTVLGFASFGVANWDRSNGNRDYVATASSACALYSGNGQPPAALFKCEAVWGYLFTGVTPPDALLNQIGNSNNPFAPLLIALVD